MGITHPFPIQSMAIPIALTGTDMIGQARTGTGKTLAFGITMLQRIVVPGERDYAQLAKPGAPQGLVVTPTRELASQVSADLTTAATRRRARVLTVYGGVGYDPQLTNLARGTEVVVGTPGRLLDLANRGSLDLSHIKVLVLDEADEMLDLGFLPDVERILALTPELRQTMLFSATMPAAIVSLARRHLRHPVNIRAESPGEEMTVPATAQFVYQAHDLDKPEVVARILQAENRNRVMIFSRTKRSAQRVADDMIDRGFAAARDPRRPQPGRPGESAEALPRRPSQRLGRHRRRRPRHRRRGRLARDQLRVPGRRQDLCAPNRPDRAGRRLGDRGDLRGLGGPDPVEGDQQHAWPAVRGAGGDLLHLPAPVPRPRHRPGGERADRATETDTGPPGPGDADRPRRRAERPRTRTRRRLRNGVPVDQEQSETVPGENAAERGSESQDTERSARRRKRHRRRSGASDPTA